ncbi:NAD(P)-dependent oxidoreductase [Caryophanon latum]|uniref:Oxidoreductase n=1 Tax=Caryophanon latum TaxID=33977 RepID=A0A1C0Z2K5_9BACL|nr:NAD(P)-dependent oxidoreductase [Caryophanon latum]OCS93679.1 oxidoreductase [Caryophanon latum]
MKRIAMIGTGVMGASIVKHLLNGGYDVTVYTRTKEKAEPLLALGAAWANTPAEAAANQEAILTMVGYPQDVEDVYFGAQGIFTTAEQGMYVIDLTTSEPMLAKRIYDEAKTRGIQSFDAPVSGGDLGAQQGTLSIMLGGDENKVEAIMPLLQTFGKNIVYQGAAGAGQHAKMCNQIVVASSMIGVCESMAYAKHAGLSPETVLQSITAGAAGSWALSNLAPRMLAADDAPGFYIKHFVKDMGIALKECTHMNLQLPGLQLANKMYNELVEQGYGDSGTQALYYYYK